MCGLHAGGGVDCWGDLFWVKADPNLQQVRHITLVKNTLLALDGTGRLLTRGFGLDSSLQIDIPLVSISGSTESFVCGLDSKGAAHCWATTRLEPMPDQGPFVEIATDETYACALKDDGSVWCWGA
jgi:hypothetical protein